MQLDNFIKDLQGQAERDTVLISDYAQRLIARPASTVKIMGWNGSDLIQLGARLKATYALAELLVAVQRGENGYTLEAVKQQWNADALHRGSMRGGSTDPMCALVERAECIEVCQLAKALKNVKS